MHNIKTKHIKILVANRGEIAVRIFRTVKQMGFESVAVYASFEKTPDHIALADHSVMLDGIDLSSTYLSIEAIINATKNTGCHAIHPGYGFLSENADFAHRCKHEGLVFIGPDPLAIERLGNKKEARLIAESINVPVLKARNIDQDKKGELDDVEFPVLIKAAYGGGGRGMRIANNHEELTSYIEIAQSEAGKFFGNSEVYIEKFVQNPRHIEVQVLGDNYGNVVHLHERECSIQRRFQKIIEEAPAINLSDGTKSKIYKYAVDIAHAVQYNNAGTVEFLIDNEENIYFLEVNTRIQVEHPVTEYVTGIDIVAQQILVALGNPLSFQQNEVNINGHAIEVRVCAESPENDFMPAVGKIILNQIADKPNTRIDSVYKKDSIIDGQFDSMISKLICWGTNRNEAIRNLSENLCNYHIHGVGHNIQYLNNIISHPAFIQGKVNTLFLKNNSEELLKDSNCEMPLAIKLAAVYIAKKDSGKPDGFKHYWRNQYRYLVELNEDSYSFDIFSSGKEIQVSLKDNVYVLYFQKISEGLYKVSFNDEKYNVGISKDDRGKYYISFNGKVDVLVLPYENEYIPGIFQPEHNADGNIVSAPLHGKITKIVSSLNKKVKQGDLLLVIESMKIENSIVAPKNGTVYKIEVSEGEQVEVNRVLMELK